MKTNEIINKLEEMFPNAKCELNYNSLFQLLVAVMLSAQATDISVNKVTPALFERFPDAESMSKASLEDIEKLIHSIGLYKNKAKNILEASKILVDEYDGNPPFDFDKLTKLPGVGRKTANVMFAEGFKVPALPVDTHVHRVTQRLGLVKRNISVEECERTLCRKIPRERWIKCHHLFIFFGRYHCKAINPNCIECPFNSICKREKK